MSTEPIEIPFTWRQKLARRWRRRREAFRAWYAKRRFYLALAGFLFVLLLLALARSIFVTIPSGHAGVVFRRFAGGTQTSVVRDEGFQVIFPWDYMQIYDVRIQQVSHTFDIISHDGLAVQVTLSIRYRPKVELLGVLHKEVGPDYLNTVVIPDVQALVRTTFGAYTPEEMYTTKRSLIEETLLQAVATVGERYVSLDALLVKEIKLPPDLQRAIETKLVEQQNSLAMEYKIQREKQEAERKVIEAKGVAAFNDIINPSLNNDLLRFRGIDATLQLAQSPNSKIVIIGDSNGLPLILDSPAGASVKMPVTPAPVRIAPPAAPTTVSR